MNNKIAIITGVSRIKGIGCAIANKLAENNIDIFFTHWVDYDRQMPWGGSEGEVKQIEKMILSKGVRCSSAAIDFMQEDAADKVFEKVIEALGYPDYLINNATYSTNQNYMTMTSEELDKHYKVNVRNTILLCTKFGEIYNKEHRGKIVNMSSGQFKGAMAEELSYVATKGAIDAFTISLADGLADKNICVNSVNPGPVDSGWMNDELKEMLIKKFPFKRIGQPEDVANLIAFLVSEQGDWITGQMLHSEGGFRR